MSEPDRNAGNNKWAWISREKVIGAVAGAVLMLLVGLATGVFQNWWEAKNPHLVYEIADAFPYKSEAENVAIYHVWIANDGNAQAEEVEAIIELPGARIDKVKITPHWLKPTYKNDKDSITVTVKSINASQVEKLQVSLVANAVSALPDKPTVILRGKGVIGELSARKASNSSRFNDFLMFINIAVGCYVVYTLVKRTGVTSEIEKISTTGRTGGMRKAP